LDATLSWYSTRRTLYSLIRQEERRTYLFLSSKDSFLFKSFVFLRFKRIPEGPITQGRRISLQSGRVLLIDPIIPVILVSRGMDIAIVDA